ncbi:hypothetical protein KCH_28260 [Kitasatospora cheerisanensis KCTC 2395]|uniref:Uncharacterized protein n=2 Tax=Kitasatospora cheerisanensis TaxID=81942 RepID=A0A066Z5H9_9ACTN|nr:hypothetical protein KCH_28260 [Kitasatospora cheerisanensis KCTC 2395]
MVAPLESGPAAAVGERASDGQELTGSGAGDGEQGAVELTGDRVRVSEDCGSHV